MSKREMSVVLKAIDLLAVAACVLVLALVIPAIEARDVVPSGSTLAFALGVAPLMVLAVVSWTLFSAIGEGEVFSRNNARRLRSMGYLAAIDVLVWLAVTVAYVALADQIVFSVVASLSVALVFCVSLAVVCVALSAFTEGAAQLKDENDLVV